ncbi:MAG: glycosyltransferase family 4 protein [Firmicutes bacterium]|nr:glycosyltransferase family 4 protein [Bacillota bacterium]
MLSWEYPPKVVGGLARHVAHLSRALAEAGHQVVVLTQEAPGAPAREMDGGVEVHRLSVGPPAPRDFPGWVMRLNFEMVERAVQLFACGRRFDLVHAHDWLAAYAGKALKHGLAVPLVATIHATEHGRNNGLHTDLQRHIGEVEWWLTYEAWRVICCSRFMEHEVRRVFQTPADKIRVVPNGVEPPRPPDPAKDEAFRARFAAPHEAIVFFLGRLVHEKGVQVLLEAAPAILARHPETRFVIAGEGPAKDGLEARARQLGVDSRVVFYGYAGDRERDSFLRIAQVAAFPSLYEPFGIVALEAMAAGTPVVATATGGFQEIVRHGQNGLLAVPGSAQSLADNIVALLVAPGFAEKLRRQALADAREKYGWPTVAARTVEVYEDVLAEYERSGWEAAEARRRAEDEWIWNALSALLANRYGSRYAETRRAQPADAGGRAATGNAGDGRPAVAAARLDRPTV